VPSRLKTVEKVPVLVESGPTKGRFIPKQFNKLLGRFRSNPKKLPSEVPRPTKTTATSGIKKPYPSQKGAPPVSSSFASTLGQTASSTLNHDASQFSKMVSIAIAESEAAGIGDHVEEPVAKETAPQEYEYGDLYSPPIAPLSLNKAPGRLSELLGYPSLAASLFDTFGEFGEQSTPETPDDTTPVENLLPQIRLIPSIESFPGEVGTDRTRRPSDALFKGQCFTDCLWNDLPDPPRLVLYQTNLPVKQRFAK